MKKIGFIDLYIDEWHANHYPNWFRELPAFNDFELGYAWEEKPLDGRRDLKQWCANFGMTAAESIAEVVEKSDAVCVLAPANPEQHERLAEIALSSGKPLFIDKPFAPDRATAERIFAKAAKYNTPLMSSSALRYGDQLLATANKFFQEEKPCAASTWGGGRSFDEYAVHQLEMIVSQLGTGARGVLCTSNVNGGHTFDIEYADGRHAQMAYHPYYDYGFAMYNSKGGASMINGGAMFKTLLDKMLGFFNTGIAPIPAAETIEIAALLEASLKSRASGKLELI